MPAGGKIPAGPPQRTALLIVSPNLCLDRILVVRDFAIGRIHRADSTAVLASGKGLNVARAAGVLGAEVTVVGVLGADDVGRRIARGAAAHGIRLRAVRVAGPSRVCTLIVDPERAETVINEPGPAVDAVAARRLMAAVRSGLRRAHAAVLAGSLPPGIPAGFYARVIRAARAIRRIPVLLDATGAPLRLGLAARPTIVKINRAELAEATGRSCSSLPEILAAAADLGATVGCPIVVTMGPDGAALVTAAGRWLVSPPPVKYANTIGAGDSLTAGLVVSLQRGMALPDALRVGVAAAAADVASLLPGTIGLNQMQALLPGVTVRAVDQDAPRHPGVPREQG